MPSRRGEGFLGRTVPALARHEHSEHYRHPVVGLRGGRLPGMPDCMPPVILRSQVRPEGGNVSSEKRVAASTTPQRRTVAIIPARYASSRFPGKPLHLIAGKPLLQHVVEQCRKANSLRDVIVATDDERIARVAQTFACVEMTRPEHPSGTDRIAEVAARLDCDAVVNVQGDEPLMDPVVIDAVEAALQTAQMSTAGAPLTELSEFENPNVVKVVAGLNGRALYFSRRTIPFLRDHAQDSPAGKLAAFPFLKHLGIYGYRRDVLLRLVQCPVSPLEAAEKLEQLRALENGIHIAVVKVNYESIGVDVPADAVRVEEILQRRLHES